MTVRLTKTFGLFVFICGFFLFNLIFFLDRYQLNDTVVENQLGKGERSQLFLKYGAALGEKTYASNFAFVRDIRSAISQVNHDVFEKYGMTSEDYEQVAAVFGASDPITFDQQQAISAFDSTTEAGVFKRKALVDFSSHLQGKTYTNQKRLVADLRKVGKNIRKYGTLNQKGIDRYQARDYTDCDI